MRGIAKVAKILGVDARMAVLEYMDTCTQLLERVKEGRPLANASNGQVWEEVLSGDFHTTCEPARPALRVMPFLVRFYLSIEDGSVQVERDLGVLTGEEAAYHGGKEKLYDDLLVLVGGPEICARDVWESTIGGVKRLGPLGQLWATLWRTVFGARLGIYRKSQVGKRRGLKKGTYVACKAGILAATENAVMARKAESAVSVDEGRPTDFGVQESFFKSAIGDFNNKKFTEFAKLTTRKRLINSHFIQRAKKWTAKRAGVAALPLQNVRSIGFVAKFGETLPATELGVDSAIGEHTSRMRCMKADLIVVDNLARLYDCPDDNMLCHVLAVIGRGASVVTLCTWNLAARNPKNVAPTSVIRHRPLAIEKRVTFVADTDFQTREGAVIHVLEALVRLEGSRWTLEKKIAVDGADEAAKTTRTHEFVHLTSDVGRLRRWLRQNSRTENVRGQRVWTLTDRMC